mgnify:CR=1 FL=1
MLGIHMSNWRELMRAVRQSGADTHEVFRYLRHLIVTCRHTPPEAVLIAYDYARRRMLPRRWFPGVIGSW